jgi:hypothetical protein
MFLLAKVKEPRARVLVLCNIYCRILHSVIRKEITKCYKIVRHNEGLDSEGENGEFYDEKIFIRILTSYLTALLTPQNDPKGGEEGVKGGETCYGVLEKLQARFILWKSKLLGWEDLWDNDESQGFAQVDLRDNELFGELMQIPFKEFSLFIDGIIFYFRVNLDYDLLHRIRNDKYCLYLRPFFQGFKESDIHSIVYESSRILELREYAFLNLGKLRKINNFSSLNEEESASKEFYLPWIFYNNSVNGSPGVHRNNTIPEVDT